MWCILHSYSYFEASSFGQQRNDKSGRLRYTREKSVYAANIAGWSYICTSNCFRLNVCYAYICVHSLSIIVLTIFFLYFADFSNFRCTRIHIYRYYILCEICKRGVFACAFQIYRIDLKNARGDFDYVRLCVCVCVYCVLAKYKFPAIGKMKT